ncbi:MAG: HD domain-containing protein [Mycobacterium sp.]|nr:MAG: HD domain-containing protein [Mycobacterium sp.]
MNMLVDQAHRLAQSHLEDTRPECWRHVCAVAAAAEQLTVRLDPASRAIVTAAAWLHDLGKAPMVRDTGFHALDGARFLARRGTFPADVIALVAHHTGAPSEAIEHGLHRQLARMGNPDPTQLALLSAADLICGPGGRVMTPAERIGDILHRYAPGHPVHRSVDRVGHALLGQAEMVVGAAMDQPERCRTCPPELVVPSRDGWHAYWSADAAAISARRAGGQGTVYVDPSAHTQATAAWLRPIAVDAANGQPLNWVQYRTQDRTRPDVVAETFDFRQVVAAATAGRGATVARRVFLTLDTVTDWQPLASPTRRDVAALLDQPAVPPPIACEQQHQTAL